MKPGQLALDLVLEPDYRAEAFAVSEANAAALALVNRWPRWRQGHLLLVVPLGSHHFFEKGVAAFDPAMNLV